MDRRRAAGLLLALAACIATATAAPTASNHTALELYDGAPDGCYYNFQHYSEGDRIMTNEPCLNCTCHNRMLMCYLRVCPFTKPIGQDCTIEKRADQCCPIVTCPDVPVDLLTSTTTSPAEYGQTGVGKLDRYGCSINGKYFPEGSKVPPTPNKPCEHCYCIRNMTTCVMQECTLHVDGCTPIYHKDVCCPVRYSCDHPEDEMPLLDDMSTTVRPTPGFLLTTTTLSPVTQMSQDCVYDNKIFPDGALIKTEKACDHCYCMKGDIVCVVQECGTPMENEGKNCTALPPRDGVCCPDTYICEGDETSSATSEPDDSTTSGVTIDAQDKLTTLSPPRRTSSEGSGYRNEPDEVSFTESSESTPTLEGSGEDEDQKLTTESSKYTPSEEDQKLSTISDKYATNYDILTSTEETHEFIPLTTTKSITESESTSVINEDITATTESQQRFTSTTYKMDTEESITDKNIMEDIGSGEAPEDESVLKQTTVKQDTLLSATTQHDSHTAVTGEPFLQEDKTEKLSDEDVTSGIINIVEQETTTLPVEFDKITTAFTEIVKTSDVTESNSYVTNESEQPSTSTVQPQINEDQTKKPEELDNKLLFTNMPEDSSQNINIGNEYLTSTITPADEDFVTTESQETSKDETKDSDHFITQHVTASTPLLEEIEKDIPEFTKFDNVQTTSSEHETQADILSTTVSSMATDQKVADDLAISEDNMPNTTKLPVFDHQEYTEKIPSSTFQPSDDKETEPEHSSTPETSVTETKITPDLELTTTDFDNVQFENSTPIISLMTPDQHTTEPDKGLNTIPSDSVEEEVSPEIQKSTSTEDIVTTEAFKEIVTTEGLKEIVTTEGLKEIVTTEGLTEIATTHDFKETATTDGLEDKFGSVTDEVNLSPISQTPKDKEELPTTSTELISRTEYSTTKSDERQTTEIAVLDEEVKMSEVNKEQTITTLEPVYTESIEVTTTKDAIETVTTNEENVTKDTSTDIPVYDKESTVANQEDNEIFNEPRIPGEGDCLQNGVTYTNESDVPSFDRCQTGCKCVSSIIKCDPIICSPPPEYMNNCETMFDSPDACCPTYICDHKSETMPPQSHSQMSGTEAPIAQPAHCQGNECDIRKDQIHQEEVSDSCKSGNCAIPPEIHTKEPEFKPDCVGEECKQVPCSLENGCQTTAVESCEGENCKTIPELVFPPKPQACAQGEDCGILNMHTPDCTGNNCDTNVNEQEGTISKETCLEQDGCTNVPQINEELCENEDCRRKEGSPIHEHVSEPCMDTNCQQPQTHSETTTTSNEKQPESDDSKEMTTEAVEVKDTSLSTQLQDITTKHTEEVTTSMYEATTKRVDFTIDQNEDIDIKTTKIEEENNTSVTTEKIEAIKDMDSGIIQATTFDIYENEVPTTETTKKLPPDSDFSVSTVTESHDQLTSTEISTKQPESQFNVKEPDVLQEVDKTKPEAVESSTDVLELYTTVSQDISKLHDVTEPTMSSDDFKDNEFITTASQYVPQSSTITYEESTTTINPIKTTVESLDNEITTTVTKDNRVPDIAITPNTAEESSTQPDISQAPDETEHEHISSIDATVLTTEISKTLVTEPSHKTVSDTDEVTENILPQRTTESMPIQYETTLYQETDKTSEKLDEEVKPGDVTSHETDNITPETTEQIDVYKDIQTIETPTTESPALTTSKQIMPEKSDQETYPIKHDDSDTSSMPIDQGTTEYDEDRFTTVPSKLLDLEMNKLSTDSIQEITTHTSEESLLTVTAAPEKEEASTERGYDMKPVDTTTTSVDSIMTTEYKTHVETTEKSLELKPTESVLEESTTKIFGLDMSTSTIDSSSYTPKKPDFEIQSSTTSSALEETTRIETTLRPEAAPENDLSQQIGTEITESDELKTTISHIDEVTTFRPTDEQLITKSIESESQPPESTHMEPTQDIGATTETSETETSTINNIDTSSSAQPHDYSTKETLVDHTQSPDDYTKEPEKPTDSLSLVTEEVKSQTSSHIPSLSAEEVTITPQEIEDKISTISSTLDTTMKPTDDIIMPTKNEETSTKEEDITAQAPSVNEIENEHTTPKHDIPGDISVTKETSTIATTQSHIVTISDQEITTEISDISNVNVMTETSVSDTTKTDKLDSSSVYMPSLDSNESATEPAYSTETPENKGTEIIPEVSEHPEVHTEKSEVAEEYFGKEPSSSTPKTETASGEKTEGVIPSEEATTIEPITETISTLQPEKTTDVDKTKNVVDVTSMTTEHVPLEYYTEQTTMEGISTTIKHLEPDSHPTTMASTDYATAISTQQDKESETKEQQSTTAAISDIPTTERVIAEPTEKIVLSSDIPIHETVSSEELHTTTLKTTSQQVEDLLTTEVPVKINEENIGITQEPETIDTKLPEIQLSSTTEEPITNIPILSEQSPKEPFSDTSELPATVESETSNTIISETSESMPESPVTDVPEKTSTTMSGEFITSIPELSGSTTSESSVTNAPEAADSDSSESLPITSESTILASSESTVPAEVKPAINTVSEPSITAETEPPVSSASETSVPTEPEPTVLSETQSTVPAETESTLSAESKPSVLSESESSMPAKSEPPVSTESDLSVPSVSDSSISSESKRPSVPGASEPTVTEPATSITPEIADSREPETATIAPVSSVAPAVPATNAPEIAETVAPELPKPVSTEGTPTEEALTPEEDGSFPPSGGTSGYGQEPDYVEEDQTFGPGTCRYGGKVYVSAQQIPRDDPCDFCFCFRSDIICLQQSCPPPIHGCHEEPIQGFCCPRYECPVSMATTVNVTTTTTTTTTTLPPNFPTHSYRGSAQKRGCQIKGQTYKVGEVVRASSGPCLHCTCGGDGQMKCEPKVCTPEPMLRQMIAAAVSAKRRR